ncbi:MAG: tetratricopeptide repeat protein [Verrucomicrobiota bacterium]
MNRRSFCLAVAWCVWLWPALCGAHPDLERQISSLTERLERDPSNSELYFQRGELYRFHQDWPAALADFDAVLRLNAHLDKARLARAETVFESGQPATAKPLLDEFLTDHPTNAEALLVRARTLVALHEYRSAIADYQASLAQQSQPRPEYYVELAQTLLCADPVNPAAAVAALDAGLQKIGPVPTLQSLAIDYELSRSNYPAALARLDAMLTQTSRKEFGLLRRGEILEKAGRKVEARAAYRQALRAVEELPAARRHVPAIEELTAKLNAKLEDDHYVDP